MSGALALLMNSTPFAVTAVDISVSVAAGNIASGSSTATVSGGSGSYTYAWVKTTGLVAATLTDDTAATATFTKNSTLAGSVSGTATVTATDTVSGRSTSFVITVSLENT